MLKAVILIGGPQKGTRFRPLSLDIPKPLFPIAGVPIIQHHIEQCIQVPEIIEIYLIGFYPTVELEHFVLDLQTRYKVPIKYLQEFKALGTAGGLYLFRDQILYGKPEGILVMNGDVCGDFPLRQLHQIHVEKQALVTVLATETCSRDESLNFGCLVACPETGVVAHYVEKPTSYIANLINCGIYVFAVKIFDEMAKVLQQQNHHELGYINLEKEILTPLAGTGKMYAYKTTNWWAQLKTAASTIYANRQYIKDCKTNTEYPNCAIHPSAIIDPTAVLGPNVSVGPNVKIGPGVRIRESIILDGVQIEGHSLVLYSILGRGANVGKWARIEGYEHQHMIHNLPLFNGSGRLNPSVTILGCSVRVAPETILLNSIVLPYKVLLRSIRNEIIL